MNKVVQLPTIAERDRIIDIKQSAALVNVSVPHYRRLYRAGKVPTPISIGERKLGNRLGAMLDFIAKKTGEAS